MANFSSVNYVRVTSLPSVKIPPGQIKGELLVAYDEYTTLANITTADTLFTAIVIPPRAKVHFMAYTIPTNGGTLSVGIVGTVGKYAAGITVGSALAAILIDNALTVEDNIIVTPTVSATGTGLYKFAMYYSQI